MRKTFKRPRDILEFDASNAFCISKDDSFPRYNTVYLTKAGEAVIDNVPECSNGPTNIGSFISSMILHVLSISTIVGSKEKEDSSKEEWFLENNGINLFDITALLSTGMYHGFSVSVVPQVLEEYNKDSFECIFKVTDRTYMAVLKSKPNEVIFIKSRVGDKTKRNYADECCRENGNAKENG